MYIFIDEAGIFVDPNNTGKSIVSIVGALIIPHYAYDAILQGFIKLKKSWGIEGEIKGKDLVEFQVDELLQMLEVHDVRFVAVCTESSLLETGKVAEHKQKFDEHVQSNISPHHHQNVIRQIKDMGKTGLKLTDQLYIQYQLMVHLVYHAQQLATIYYVQRVPSELGIFKWIIDAKGKTITEAESWWKEILMSSIQGLSFKDPMIMLEGADYSYYKKFDSPDDPKVGNINEILKDFEFGDSKSFDGLQLVDAVTTSLRKAFNNKFGILGWYRIGRIMIKLYEPNVVFLLGFDEQKVFSKNLQLKFVIEKLRKSSKSAIIM